VIEAEADGCDAYCPACGCPWYKADGSPTHYDGAYCMENLDNEKACCCGPCQWCGKHFVQKPKNHGLCPTCESLP
jgi:hypothetical protein